MATVVFGGVEWDDRKAAASVRKHGVSFEEAITALADPHAIGAPDLLMPARWITIGRSGLLRVPFVVHTENSRGDESHHQRSKGICQPKEEV